MWLDSEFFWRDDHLSFGVPDAAVTEAYRACTAAVLCRERGGRERGDGDGGEGMVLGGQLTWGTG